MVEAVDPGTAIAGVRISKQPEDDFEIFIRHADGEESAVGTSSNGVETLTKTFTEFLHFIGHHGDVDDVTILDPESATTFIEWADEIAAATDE